jgi:hypothetical protein
MARPVTMSAAAAIGYVPPHPDRTAYRNAGGGMNFDLVFREWPSRAAMVKTIEMQGRRESRNDDWHDWSRSRYAKRTNFDLGICPCKCHCGPICDHKTCPCAECVEARPRR